MLVRATRPTDPTSRRDREEVRALRREHPRHAVPGAGGQGAGAAAGRYHVTDRGPARSGAAGAATSRAHELPGRVRRSQTVDAMLARSVDTVLTEIMTPASQPLCCARRCSPACRHWSWWRARRWRVFPGYASLPALRLQPGVRGVQGLCRRRRPALRRLECVRAHRSHLYPPLHRRDQYAADDRCWMSAPRWAIRLRVISKLRYAASSSLPRSPTWRRISMTPVASSPSTRPDPRAPHRVVAGRELAKRDPRDRQCPARQAPTSRSLSSGSARSRRVAGSSR